VRIALTYLTYTSQKIKQENKKIKEEQLKLKRR
jgi:hypothetical protein